MDVTPKFLAEVLGLSRQRITQLKGDGILTATGSPLKYDLAESVQAYIAYVKDGLRHPAETEDAERRKLKADADYKEARAREAEIHLAELEGRMHSADDVRAATEELVYAVRSALLALPGRVGVSVAGKTPSEAAAIVREECEATLRDLSGFRYDPDAYARMVRDRQGWQVDDEE